MSIAIDQSAGVAVLGTVGPALRPIATVIEGWIVCQFAKMISITSDTMVSNCRNLDPLTDTRTAVLQQRCKDRGNANKPVGNGGGHVGGDEPARLKRRRDMRRPD